jgi:hypothetical protein
VWVYELVVLEEDCPKLERPWLIKVADGWAGGYVAVCAPQQQHAPQVYIALHVLQEKSFLLN